MESQKAFQGLQDLLGTRIGVWGLFMESQKAFPNHLKQAFPNHLKKAFPNHLKKAFRRVQGLGDRAEKGLRKHYRVHRASWLDWPWFKLHVCGSCFINVSISHATVV